MIILPATLGDTATILELQRLAYQTEAALYDDFAIPPLVETLDDLRSQFSVQQFFKAVDDGRIVGSVRAMQRDTTCRIGRLIVHPACRRRGIGTALMGYVEMAFPDAARFELFTGHKSENNIRLYERLGYRAFRREPVNERLTMVFLEKRVAQAGRQDSLP